MNKTMPYKLILRVLRIVGTIVFGITVTYAIVFSIAGTIALYIAYKNVIRPFHEVQYLVQHNPQETVFMRNYCQEMKTQHKPAAMSQIFVPLDSISKNLKLSVLAAEDDGFYTHPGIDIPSILNAYQYNKVHNRNLRGASTITQQVAKNLFLTKEKSFARKFRELGYTLLLENICGKDRILELYLNYAQWGDSLFGCEAASQCYYRKPCSRLTLMESMRMAATLASPERLSPLNGKSVFIQKRIEVIANNLYLKHIIGDAEYQTLCGKSPPKDTLSDTLEFTKMKEVARAAIVSKYFTTSQQPAISAKKGRRN